MRWVLVAGALVLASCGTKHYGAYFNITAPGDFDKLEFFFGGDFPSRRCNNELAQGVPPPLRQTAAWSRTTEDPKNDTLLRRQYHDTDVQTFTPAARTATYYVPTDANLADPPYPDTLGKKVVVVASLGGQVIGIASLDNFMVNSGEIDRYPITLAAPPPGLEVWGGSAPSCLRVPSASGSLFIVREWDHDCDGLATKLCDYDGKGVEWNDCDPEAYCSPTDPTGCMVHQGCEVPDPSTAEAVCKVGTCSNPGAGALRCDVPDAFCLSRDACSTQAHCDRRLMECVISDSTPDLTCKVPVHDGSNGSTKNAPCIADPGTGVFATEIYGQNKPADGCGTVVRAAPKSPADMLTLQFTPVVAPDMVSCDLIGQVPTATTTLPETRVILEAQLLDPSSVAHVVTMIVDLTPAPGDCSDPQPQCQLSGASPLGMPHACPEPAL